MILELDSYNNEKVTDALSRVGVGLEKYQYLMNNFNSTDVSIDTNFQKKFNGFYKVRRNSDFREKYYSYMQINKKEVVSFESTLRYIYLELGSVEASFSSKLVATINPNMPIWDSFVLNNIGLKAPKRYKAVEERIEEIVKIYQVISEWYDNALKSNRAKEMIEMFDDKYPNSNISQLKKLDFILWQIR